MQSDSENKPADYKKWVQQKDLWTLLEVATICIGIEPFRNPEPYPAIYKAQICDAAKRNTWDDLYDGSKRAIKRGTLKSYGASPKRVNGILHSPYWVDVTVDPREYVAWAQSKGFDLPQELIAALQLNAPAESKPEITKETPQNWKMQIQSEAARRWRALKEAGASPTKHSLKAELAKWCRENNIETTGGIYPDKDYIYRHVLSKWTPPEK